MYFYAIGSNSRSHHSLDAADSSRIDTGSNSQQFAHFNDLCRLSFWWVDVRARLRFAFDSLQAVGLVPVDLVALSGKYEASIAIFPRADYGDDAAHNLFAGVAGSGWILRNSTIQ